MFTKFKELTLEKKLDKAKDISKKVVIIAGLILVGYVAGRITCVQDYRTGKLDEIFKELDDME